MTPRLLPVLPTLLIPCLLCLVGCPREAFVPGCDDVVTTPSAAELIPSIGWTGQELIDRSTWVFAHPDGEWSDGTGATVYVNVTADPGTLALHTLSEQTPPDGVPVASIAPLCLDSLSVDAQVDLQVDGGLDRRFDATVVVTEGDDDPETRSATVHRVLDPSTFPDPWVWRELTPGDWDSASLTLDLRLTAQRSAPGTLSETGERTDGDLAEATSVEVLSWGGASGDDDDAADDDDDGR